MRNKTKLTSRYQLSSNRLFTASGGVRQWQQSPLTPVDPEGENRSDVCKNIIHILSWSRDISCDVLLTTRVTPDIRLVSGYPACFSGIRLTGRIVGDIRPDSRIISKIKLN